MAKEILDEPPKSMIPYETDVERSTRNWAYRSRGIGTPVKKWNCHFTTTNKSEKGKTWLLCDIK